MSGVAAKRAPAGSHDVDRPEDVRGCENTFMPHRYPQEAALRDGRRVLLRPFKPNDVDELHAFFMRLPERDRRFAWERIEDRAVVEEWARSLDYSRTFPLLALDGDRIVADATLHLRRTGPLRLVGRVRWLIDPDYRRQGLGTTLVHQLVGIARENDLRRLTCMLISELEEHAIEVLKSLGFRPYLIPGYGTDPDGGQHDMTMLVLQLS
jgi:acetyltransferase